MILQQINRCHLYCMMQPMQMYRQYLIVGGMPECVRQFVETGDYILVDIRRI